MINHGAGMRGVRLKVERRRIQEKMAAEIPGSLSKSTRRAALAVFVFGQRWHGCGQRRTFTVC